MAVDQPDVVDLISIDGKTGDLVLTVSDHLDWSDTVKHQTILQAKFNAYLAFVESGEVFHQYPEGKGRSITLKVVFKFKPDREGVLFLNKASQVIESAGLALCQELFAESYNN